MDKAESAFDQSDRLLQSDDTPEHRRQHELATRWRSERQRNLDWQTTRQYELDQNGVVIFDGGLEPHLLDARELEWNLALRQTEEAQSSAEPAATGAAAASAGPNVRIAGAAAASAGPTVGIAGAPAASAGPTVGIAGAAAASAGPSAEQPPAEARVEDSRRHFSEVVEHKRREDDE